VELSELRAEFHEMVERLPRTPDSPLDSQGRPALGAGRDLRRRCGQAARRSARRHGARQWAPCSKSSSRQPAPDLPEQVPFIILAPLQYSEAALRLSAIRSCCRSPAIYGSDFVPFTEAVIIKKPGEGLVFLAPGRHHPLAGRRLGSGHHGFNFMAQLYGSTAANGVWYLPGTHCDRKVDLKSMLAAAAATACQMRCR